MPRRSRTILRWMVVALAWVSLSMASRAWAEPVSPVVPETDPKAEAPKLVADVMARHPRLLFGPDDVTMLRQFAHGHGKRFFDQLVDYRAACRPPKKPDFLTNATNGQRIGLWRMPTVALHYLITGEAESQRDAIGYMKLLLELPHWETGSERDSGMSSANVLIGAALAYDWLHDDLEPAFRERFRRKLIHMARAQYYGGHLNRNRATGYWQGDPANNHRWHRDAGMVLAALTAYEGDPAENWLLARCAEEMALVNRWLPDDGTSHEGPGYFIFGGAHLTLACQAADRCFGTEYLRGDYFANAARFRLHTTTPGFGGTLHFGDSAGMGNYSNFLWKCTAVHRQPDLQAGLEKLYARHGKAWWLGWMSLVWFDPALPVGEVNELETKAFFPDLGLATLRDRWTGDGVAVMFKCGPFGGRALNAFRNQHNFRYVNVAHDDPDANAFILFADGHLLAETDRYSNRKKSANHNTILIGGMGQTVTGRKEGMGWSQPATGRTDMNQMAFVTAYKQAGEVVVVEGEAAGSYPAVKGVRPALERFRRTFIWAEDKYLLVLDDIRAPNPVEITWLMQGPELRQAPATGRYVLARSDARCPFAVESEAPMKALIVDSPADHRGKPLGWKQLRLTGEAQATRLVSVFDPWHTHPKFAFAPAGSDRATVKVTGDGYADTWNWPAATGGLRPTELAGERDGKELIRIGADDARGTSR